MKRRWLIGLSIALAAFLIMEGAASTALFLWDGAARFERPIQERHHTRYDPELGWVNVPGLHDPNLYAPGRALTTNAQGFRDARDSSLSLPPGRLRVLCAGDSFTLGYGVGDGDTWPAQLEAARPDLEVVNMGQGGYGLDQAFLWYRRDGTRVPHDLVLLAFIGDDFERMRSARFRGYAKPLLRERDGRLALTGVPVPEGSLRFPLLSQNVKLLQRLRLFELATRAFGKLGTGASSDGLDEDEAERVALAIFRETAALAQAQGARCALVLLPNLYWRDPTQLQAAPAYALRALARAAAEGLPYFDLTAEFATLEADARQALFIPKGELDLPGAAGHYNAEGNRLVARALAQRLAAAGLLGDQDKR